MYNCGLTGKLKQISTFATPSLNSFHVTTYDRVVFWSVLAKGTNALSRHTPEFESENQTMLSL
jgi:hypothetical protein